MLLKFIVYFCCYSLVDAKFYKTNITDFDKCKIYYSRSGSIYQDFFELSDEPTASGYLLDFHFSVLASSDAHILLAPSTKLEKNDPVYEVVIGAGGNTFCDIRRMQKSMVKASIRIKGLLSGLDIQSFWLHISRDGLIDVGRDGEELALISWVDPDPLPLKVFSFSTWPGVEAKWFFDCPRGDNITSHSKEIPRNLTSLERLRKDLLYYYDSSVRPVKNISTNTVVTMLIETKLISLDEHKSTMQVDGKIYLQWQDEKLRWSPSNYSEIEYFHIFRPEIWVPNLHLFNSVEHGSDILEDSNLIVNSSGVVSWKTIVHLKSWCNPDDLGNWPRDIHSCNLILGFFKDFSNIQLIFDVNASIFDSILVSEWKIIEIVSITNKGWRNSSRDSSEYFDPPGLNLTFKIKRISNTYHTILFSPFYIVSVCLLASFCVSPYGYLKMFLACSPLILSTIMLIALGLLIPVHSRFVPNLVLLYSNSLIATVICIIIAIIVINMSRNNWQWRLPQMLSNLLTSHLFKRIFLLPNVKNCDKYGNLNESSTKLNENQQSIWILFGIFIDRIAFLAYSILVIYAFSITY